MRITLAAAAVFCLTATCPDFARAQMPAGRSRSLAAADQPQLALPGVRPITDFTNAQGTTSFFYPPAPDYAIGMTTATCTVPHCPGRIAVVDYAGGANRYLRSQGYPSLGTNVEGSIVEVPLSDGRAQVTVVLHTTNAVTFASKWDASTGLDAPPGQSAQNNTRLFGYTVSQILEDPRHNHPALAESHLVLVFKNTAPRAPMPDLVKWLALGMADSRLELDSLYFDANAAGTLHAAANLGPEGTAGRCIVSQFALFTGPVQGPDGGFFTEIVDLHPTGN